MSKERNPLSLKYVQMLRLSLWSIAAWPGEELGEEISFVVRCLRILIITEVLVVAPSEMYFVYRYYKEVDFYVLGYCYIIAFMGVVAAVRIVLTKLKTFEMLTKEFLMSFHLLHYKPIDVLYYNKIYTFINKVSHFYTIYMVTILITGPTLITLSTVYHNYQIGAFTGNRVQNSTIQFVAYLALPGFNPYDWFLSVTLFNIIVTYVCVVLFVGNDLLLTLMIFQIIGHIQILRNNLQNIPKPKKQIVLEDVDSEKGQVCAIYEVYDAEENKYIHKILTECVDHHRMIVSFTDKLSNFFGLMLAVSYMFQLFSCCLLLLEWTQVNIDTFMCFGPLTTFVFGQLVMISCIFEIVGTVSEKIKDNVYDIPWECMDIRNQRTVCIILNRVQTPITITAMGMVPVGVTTMAAILKTTFTYFTFLRSTQN